MLKMGGAVLGGFLRREGRGARLFGEGAGLGALRQGLMGGEDEHDAAQGGFGGD